MAISIKKGDTVQVTKGKDRGKRGKVLKMFPTENRLIVETLNLVTSYTRPSQQNPKGGVIKVEGKLPRPNVQLVCPRCSKLTRIGFQLLADGVKQRVCKKCNEII